DIVVAEYPLPRHLYVLEQNRGIALVETAGERIVELADRVFLIGFARPDADAMRIERHHAGDRFFLLPRRHRLKIATPCFVAEDRRSAEHLQSVDGDAAVVLGDYAQGRGRSVCRAPWTGQTPALRIGHRVRGEDVIASHVLVVVLDVVAEARPDALQHRRALDGARAIA